MESEEIQDALNELRQYLSDILPPLLVSDSVQLLMSVPPEAIVREILGWAEAQSSYSGSLRISDFFYHSLRKIYMLGEYHLIAKEELQEFLRRLSPHLIACCPAESREALQSGIERLGTMEGGGGVIERQAEVIYRLGTESGGQPAGGSTATTPASDPSAGATTLLKAALNGISATELSHFGKMAESFTPARMESFADRGPMISGSIPSVDSSIGTLSTTSMRESAFPPNLGASREMSPDAFLPLLHFFSEMMVRREAPDRPGSGPAPSDLGAALHRQEEVSVQLIAAAARTARSAQQLEEHMKQIQTLGMDVNPLQAIHQLAADVPNCALTADPSTLPAKSGKHAATKGGSQLYSNSRLEAMRRMVELGGSPGEVSRRFREMIGAAINEFNQGALARAVAILDSAREMIAGGKTDRSTVENIQHKLHEQVSYDRLYQCAGETAQKPLLRRFLNFFHALAPAGLLSQIRQEEQRERRLALLGLMEVHGDSARHEILLELNRLLQEGVKDLQDPWFFQRNLLYLLSRIPSASQQSEKEEEVDVLARFSEAQLAKEVLRELIRNLSLHKNEKAESALVEVMNQFQQSIEGMISDKASRQEIDEMFSLLDRVITALAGFESRNAHRIVLDYCLVDNPGTRHSLTTLAALGEQDLSTDQDALHRLQEGLKKELPSKMLGMLMKKDRPNAVAIIRSLSGTNTMEVQDLLHKIMQRNPESDYGQAAAKALTGFKKGKEKTPAAAAGVEDPSLLSGELKSFDLPTLLQYFETTSTTGMMTLTGPDNAVCARLILEKGKLKGCKSTRLQGVNAVYAMLEKPLLGRFALVHLTTGVGDEIPVLDQPMPLTWVLMEGVRRYDEYLQACLIAPDHSQFQTMSQDPPAVEEESDPELVQSVWRQTAQGLSPQQIESESAVDPYRVRRLLSAWHSQGAIKALPSRMANPA